MSILSFHHKIGKNYDWELDLFYKYRSFKDGIDFFELKTNWDRYICDHNPKFEFGLRILNYTIFDFSIYNVWHTDHPNSPYFGMDDSPDYEMDNHE